MLVHGRGADGMIHQVRGNGQVGAFLFLGFFSDGIGSVRPWD